MFDMALRCGGGDPPLNLALEESLLERGFGRASAVLFYINDPCVVIGRNQNPWAEVAAGCGLPVLRRVSGGGAVYHDRGNLNWSILVPRSLHDRDAELAMVAGALWKLGVDAESGPRGGLFVASDGPWKGAKLSGTARRLTATRVLHHGTLLVGADLGRLSSSLAGIEVESSKALPSVRSPSVNLSTLVPGIGVHDAMMSIALELTGTEPEAAEALADRPCAEEAARRLAAWEWTWGATPAFSVSLPWSGGCARIQVINGIVASVSGEGSERISGVAGRRFGYELPTIAVQSLEGSGSIQ